MSFASMYQARRALTKFAAEWGDSRTRAALRTTSDEGRVFTFFSDAQRFESVAAQLRYNIQSNQGVRSVQPMVRPFPCFRPSKSMNIGL